MNCLHANISDANLCAFVLLKHVVYVGSFIFLPGSFLIVYSEIAIKNKKIAKSACSFY